MKVSSVNRDSACDEMQSISLCRKPANVCNVHFSLRLHYEFNRSHFWQIHIILERSWLHHTNDEPEMNIPVRAVGLYEA